MNADNKPASLWQRWFLEERPSIGLAFFRLFVAFTVGAHILPTLFQLKDNYLSTAFKEVNPTFFTPGALALVAMSPDGFVIFMTVFFCVSLLFFAVGLFSQIASICMVIGCYYFYALNSMHIGTLSYDILLVTLFLMCVTGYHGDYFSLDALRSGNPDVYKKKRPFFIQRLLQLQIASTYFYTALCKFTASGNWITSNPIYYLVNSTPESVVKQFPFRSVLAKSPELCYAIGISVIVAELLLPFLLFIKKTRVLAIGYGFFFQTMLVVTLHVPTIFFFLFPAQLLLFIDPEDWITWIEKIRKKNEEHGQDKLIYDGHCNFCIGSLRRVQVLDLFGKLKPVDYQAVQDVKTIDARLTREICHSQMQLLTQDGKLYGGFYVFRRLTLKLPLLYLLAPVLYFPGMQWPGNFIYSFIAKNRYLFHRKSTCKDNACFR